MVAIDWCDYNPISQQDYLNWVDYTYRPIVNTTNTPTTNTLKLKKNTKPTLSARPRRQVSLW
jgi:hypothetical protein